MDLNELKNLNMDDLKAKVLAFADKKTLIKIGVSLGSIIVFLIIYYSILNPIVNAKKAKIDDMNLKQQEITKFNNDIKKAKRKIKKLTPEYEKYSTLFHSKAEVEGLYQSLSQFAGENGLAWSQRLLMVDAPLKNLPENDESRPFWNLLGSKYGYSEQNADKARLRIISILEKIGKLLTDNQTSGDQYFLPSGSCALFGLLAGKQSHLCKQNAP